KPSRRRSSRNGARDAWRASVRGFDAGAERLGVLLGGDRVRVDLVVILISQAVDRIGTRHRGLAERVGGAHAQRVLHLVDRLLLIVFELLADVLDLNEQAALLDDCLQLLPRYPGILRAVEDLCDQLLDTFDSLGVLTLVRGDRLVVPL